ncbi:MAG: lytic transglycosylase F, partial [Bacteroidales bacterium]
MRAKYILLLLILSLIGSYSCQQQPAHKPGKVIHSRSWKEIQESGELHILTLYSSTSYFIYKGEEMGYEFELARSFAQDQKLRPVVKVATNIHQLMDMLKNGEGDLVAFPIPHMLEASNEGISYCGNENITSQVLIQRIEKKKNILR